MLKIMKYPPISNGPLLSKVRLAWWIPTGWVHDPEALALRAFLQIFSELGSEHSRSGSDFFILQCQPDFLFHLLPFCVGIFRGLFRAGIEDLYRGPAGFARSSFSWCEIARSNRQRFPQVVS